MSTKVVTGKVRFSFVNVWEPKEPQGGGDPKYSVTLLIPAILAVILIRLLLLPLLRHLQRRLKP